MILRRRRRLPVSGKLITFRASALAIGLAYVIATTETVKVLEQVGDAFQRSFSALHTNFDQRHIVSTGKK